MNLLLVCRQFPVLVESNVFLAHIARKRPLAGMDPPNVNLQFRVPLVDLVAVGTLVWMDTLVGQLVELASRVRSEGFVTLVAFVGFFFGMNFTVVDQVSFRFKAGETYLTFEWAFVGMRNKVDVEVRLSEEAFVAIFCRTFELL